MARSPRVRRRPHKEPEPDEPAWKAVHRAADRNVGKVAAAYAGSLSVLRTGVNREAVRVALERNDPGMEIAAFQLHAWQGVLGRMLLPRLQETMRQAGEAVGRKTVIRSSVRKDFTLRGVFNLLNPRAQRIAAEIAARLVTRIGEGTRWAMRQVIADAQAQGVSVRDQAAQLADILVEQAGLDGPRSRALTKYRQLLEAQGVRDDLMEQRVGQMRDQLIMDRARTIARHETQDAAVAGQVEVWDQAVENGLLPTTVQEEWIVANDDRLCPICAPMDGQRVRRGQLFVSPYDGSTHARPPAHILCRCSLALVDPLGDVK